MQRPHKIYTSLEYEARKARHLAILQKELPEDINQLTFRMLHDFMRTHTDIPLTFYPTRYGKYENFIKDILQTWRNHLPAEYLTPARLRDKTTAQAEDTLRKYYDYPLTTHSPKIIKRKASSSLSRGVEQAVVHQSALPTVPPAKLARRLDTLHRDDMNHTIVSQNSLLVPSAEPAPRLIGPAHEPSLLVEKSWLLATLASNYCPEFRKGSLFDPRIFKMPAPDRVSKKVQLSAPTPPHPKG